MKKIILFLLLSVNAFASSLNFTTERSLLLVKVNIEGKEMILIFDTGAERTLINSHDGVEHVKIITVGKSSMRLPLAYVPLDGMGLEKVRADGVLGQDILRRYKTVSIDYSSKTITLE